MHELMKQETCCICILIFYPNNIYWSFTGCAILCHFTGNKQSSMAIDGLWWYIPTGITTSIYKYYSSETCIGINQELYITFHNTGDDIDHLNVQTSPWYGFIPMMQGDSVPQCQVFSMVLSLLAVQILTESDTPACTKVVW